MCSRRSTLPLWSVGAIITVVLLSCVAGTSMAQEPECQSEDDCGPGYFCREGECDGACEGEGTACPGSFVCDGDWCVECLTDAECILGADEALDCPGCQMCRNGSCTVGCDEALNPCTEGEICADRRCVDCVVDTDCAEGRACARSRCVACREAAHCPEGEYCVQSGCVACRGEADCDQGFLCLGGACADCTAECAGDDCPGRDACTLEDCSDREFETVYFDFDESYVRTDQESRVEHNAACLWHFAEAQVTIEGHTDERRSEAYSFALAQRRARSVGRMLERMGIDGSRLTTVSYGESRPMCDAHNESCWRQNRRVSLTWR